ncbi:hypothetical protein [Stenotrophomonas sp. PS02297]|uniref:hypothetical protein n=1 Tax=Stenotrophomonas sp. PS02297 TaxID=2991423 RepID=UPI00249B8AF8|nr:hypothetical protein [Stenotrophomonas sp. PS02297]
MTTEHNEQHSDHSEQSLEMVKPAAAQEAGQRLSELLCSLAESGQVTLDPFDSNSIDAIVAAVLGAAPVTAAPANDLHQHLLHMLGAKDHEDAGRIIGELHAAALRTPAAPGIDLAEAHQLAFEIGGDDEGGYQFTPEELEQFVTRLIDASPKGDATESHYRAALEQIATQGPHYGPDGTRETWKHWSDMARDALIAASPKGGSAATELLSAAKDFYNGTVADPAVRISCSTKERRDRVKAIGERLRDALKAAQASDAEVRP